MEKERRGDKRGDQFKPHYSVRANIGRCQLHADSFQCHWLRHIERRRADVGDCCRLIRHRHFIIWSKWKYGYGWRWRPRPHRNGFGRRLKYGSYERFWQLHQFENSASFPMRSYRLIVSNSLGSTEPAAGSPTEDSMNATGLRIHRSAPCVYESTHRSTRGYSPTSLTFNISIR